MQARLSRFAAGHPVRTLALLAAIGVLGFGVAALGLGDLVVGGERQGAQRLLIRTVGAQPARSPSYRVVLRTMRSQVSLDPAVGSVHVRFEPRRPREAVLVVGFGSASSSTRDAAVGRIEANLDPGPLRVSYRGQSAELRQAREAIISDLDLLLLALPVAVLLLVGALGGRPALSLALAAAATIGLAAAVFVALGVVIDVSVLALAGVAIAGFLSATQLCLLARRGAAPAALAAASVAAAAVHASLGALGVWYLSWLGAGGALAALLAFPASLAAMDATTALWGPASDRQGTDERAFRRLHAPLVRWRLAALAALLVSVAALAAATLPLRDLALITLAGRPPAIDAAQVAVAVALAVATLTVIAWLGCRRPVLAASAALSSALPAAAAAGLLVWVFQDGRLEQLLDYSSAGGVYLGALAGIVAVVGAVSASRWAALLSSIREVPRLAFRTLRGPVDGPAAAAPALLTTLIGAAAGIALAFSSLLYLKQFGFGIAAGLLLDLILVRVLLAPALLRLFGARQ